MKPEIRKTRYCLIAIASLLMVLLAQPALAVTKNWAVFNLNTLWTNPLNWSPIFAPVAGDNALLTSTTSKTATLNTVTPLLNSVTINATGGATFTLTQSSSSTALSAGSETIGTNGKGTYNQSGGSNTVTNALTLGQNAGSTGTYTKNGGSLTAGALVIGLGGTGSFTQNSYTVTIGAVQPDPGQPFSLILGGEFNSGTPITTGKGTYTMSSGLLQVGSGEVIGQAGTGIFSQAGGTHTIVGLLAVGNQTGSSGIYTMGGGLLQVGSDENIGASGNGSFTQTSGSHTIGGDLNVGRNGGSSGTFKMSSGSLDVGGNEDIGASGNGSFTQISGSHTIKNNLTLGDQANKSGAYTMGGSLSVGGDEVIGNNGNGSFTQSSGSHTIGGDLNVGRNGGSSGTFKMSSGSLSVGGNEDIGASGNGSFTQNSGSHTIKNNLTLGDQAGIIGAYTLTSGSLSVGGDEVIGNNGLGSFTQTSGSNSAKTLTLAKNAGSLAAYNLNGGGVSVSSSALDAIHINGSTSSPAAGTGTFNVSGTATVTGNVTNDGNVKTTGANVTWNGTFTNNNVYTSDPSTQTFTDLKVNTTGYLVGNSPLAGTFPTQTAQDLFIFKNDFINQSTQNTSFNTVNAEMKFITGADTSHNLAIAGVVNPVNDRIPPANNFSWYALDITGQTIDLQDGNAGNASTAVYVGQMLGAIINGSNQVTNIVGGPDAAHPIFIYYDPALTANAYLLGADYAFATGFGALKWDPPEPAVPLPPSVLLLGSGVLGLGILGYRKKQG